MAMNELTAVRDDGYQTDIFFYSSSDYANETLVADEYTTSVNEIFHLGASSHSSTENLVIVGLGDKDDCYVACLEMNGGHCLTFSYKVVADGPDDCVIPIDIAKEKLLEDFTQASSAGYIAYFSFTPNVANNSATVYTDSHPISYMDSADVKFHIGGSVTHANNRLFTGVGSSEHCYRLCLMINNRRCMIYSYSSPNCYIPLDDGDMAMNELTAVRDDGYQTDIFFYSSSDYANEILVADEYTTSVNEIFHLGASSHASTENLVIVGLGDKDDCYVACLEMNDGHCLTFSYKVVADGPDDCVIPIDIAKDKTLEDFTQASSTGYIAYFFFTPNIVNNSATDYMDVIPSKWDSTDALFYLSGNSSNVSSNFIVTGPTTALECYRLCLMINNEVCLVFSFSSDASVCRMPLHSNSLVISDLSVEYSTGYTSTFFFYSPSDYFGETLSADEFTYSNGEVYHLGTGVADDTANFIIRGIDSVDHCYVACLERNGGHCITFSYKDVADALNTCLIPIDSAHDKTLLDFTKTPVSDYKAYIIFTPNVDNTSALAYADPLPTLATDSADTLMYLGSSADDGGYNLKVTGVNLAAHCYRLCLMISSGDCLVFSWSSSATTCYVPLHTAATNVEDFLYTGSAGYTTYRYFYVDSTHFNAITLDASKYTKTRDEVYHLGDSVSKSDNLIFGGIDSAVDCYVACLDHLDSRCLVFSFNYTAEDSGECIVPDSKTVTLSSLKREGSGSYLGYTVYIFFTPNLADGSETSYDVALAGSQTESTNVLFYLGSGPDDDVNNLRATGVDSLLKCYRLCLMINSGNCLIFSWSSSDTTCVAPYYSVSHTFTSFSFSLTSGYTSYSYFQAASSYFGTTLNADDYTIATGEIFYLGTGTGDASANHLVNGLTNVDHCYVECLEINSGRCLSFSFSATTAECIIPRDASANLKLENVLHTPNTDFTTYLFFKPSLTNNNGAFTDALPANAVESTDVVFYAGSAYDDTADNLVISGVDSPVDCYRVCLMLNYGHCIMFSWSSSPDICVAPIESASKIHDNLKHTMISGYTGYLYLYTSSAYLNQQLEADKYVTASDRVFHRGSAYTGVYDVSAHGLDTPRDCYMACLENKDGRCLTFSFNPATAECYFIKETNAGIAFKNLRNTIVSGFTSYVFFNPDVGDSSYHSYSDSLPSDVTNTDGVVFYLGTGIDDDDENLQMVTVASAEYCYRVCLMLNNGVCKVFSYHSSSETCVVPRHTNTLLYTDLSHDISTGYTGYLYFFVDSYITETLSDYTVSNDKIFYAGASYSTTASNYQVAGITSFTDCYRICLSVNSGVCLTFSFSSTTGLCYFPLVSSSDDLSDLASSSVSTYVTYFVLDPEPTVNNANDYTATVSSSDYTIAPDQLLYKGASSSNTANNFIASGVGSHGDCYRLCQMYHSGSCYAYTYGASTCHFPLDVSSMSGLSTEASNSYMTYVLYHHTDDSSGFSAGSWSTLSDLVIKGGQSEGAFNIYFKSVFYVARCYRLCLLTVDNCQTFSYRPSDYKCYIADANFHTDWTFVEPNTGAIAYFIKDSSSYKLLTKHVRDHGYLPHEAFTDTGGYHETASATDLLFSDTDTGFTYLKSQLIDYWSDLSSKDKIRVELYSASGTLLQYVAYDASGTTSTNWFSDSYFDSTSWSDLSDSASFDDWEMGTGGRTFYLSHKTRECQKEEGWLMVVEGTNSGCGWERGLPGPNFLYSADTEAIKWKDNVATFDVLIIKMSFD